MRSGAGACPGADLPNTILLYLVWHTHHSHPRIVIFGHLRCTRKSEFVCNRNHWTRKSESFGGHSQPTPLTLSLPVFWQICFLNATFILTVNGIMPYEASTFSEIVILQFFLSITFDKYLKSELSKLKTHWRRQNIWNWGNLNQGSGGCPSRRSATLAVCYDVAVRRRWQRKS